MFKWQFKVQSHLCVITIVMQWRDVLGFLKREIFVRNCTPQAWYVIQVTIYVPHTNAAYKVLVLWWRVITRLSSGNFETLGPITPSPFRKDLTTLLDALSFRLIHSSLMFFSVVFANTGNIYQGMVEIIWWRNIVTTDNLSSGRVRSWVLWREKRFWCFVRLEFESTCKLKNLLIPNRQSTVNHASW